MMNESNRGVSQPKKEISAIKIIVISIEKPETFSLDVNLALEDGFELLDIETIRQGDYLYLMAKLVKSGG